MDCIYAVEELKTSLADLQQQKLDNIVDDFEALASWSNAISNRADALMDYYTAAGRVVNSDDAKHALDTQRWEAKQMTGRYQKEAEAFEKEMQNAEKLWGRSSTRFREALAKYEEIQQQLIESQTKIKELDKAIFELDVTKIEYALDRLKQFSEKITSIFNLKEARGTQYGQRPESSG